jgi:hypothetical protein
MSTVTLEGEKTIDSRQNTAFHKASFHCVDSLSPPEPTSTGQLFVIGGHLTQGISPRCKLPGKNLPGQNSQGNTHRSYPVKLPGQL